MQARAIVVPEVNRATAASVEIPEPGAGEVLVEILFSSISPGTELRCMAGKQPNGIPFPYITGYSASGRIVAVGEGVTLPVGTIVYSSGTTRSNIARQWGGHVSYAVQRAETVIPVPEGVDLLDASLAHLAAISYHGVRLSVTQPHEKVAVIGLGPIGQLAARLHAAAGAHVVAADLSPARVEMLRAVGVDAFVPQGDIVAEFHDFFPNGADVVVDATGAASVLPSLIPIAKDVPWDDQPTPGARFLVQGSYPADFCVPYQDAFIKQLTIMLPRDTQPRDIVTVLELMRRGKLQVRDLISDVRSPEAADQTYADLRAGTLMTAAFAWK